MPLLVLVAFLVLAGPVNAVGGSCAGPLAVQVLGSGGPEIDAHRASSGYLVWIDGHARVLVDLGGGTFTRFGASGARFEDLELVALTHLHVDHAGDLPALLKGGFFTERTRPLVLAGPTGGGDFPDLEGFLLGLIGPDHGAFRYLRGYLDGGRGLIRLDRRTLDAGSREPMPVYRDGDLMVTALGVTHGPVPALAYRVAYGHKSIGFSGDQIGDDPEVAEFFSGVDLLVMHHAVPENTGRIPASLHALPSEIGSIAEAAGAGHLLLSHLMHRSERALPESLDLIGRRFKGRISVAEDLMCVAP